MKLSDLDTLLFSYGGAKGYALKCDEVGPSFV
jgi:hypothetical protein